MNLEVVPENGVQHERHVVEEKRRRAIMCATSGLQRDERAVCGIGRCSDEDIAVPAERDRIATGHLRRSHGWIRADRITRPGNLDIPRRIVTRTKLRTWVFFDPRVKNIRRIARDGDAL